MEPADRATSPQLAASQMFEGDSHAHGSHQRCFDTYEFAFTSSSAQTPGKSEPSSDRLQASNVIVLDPRPALLPGSREYWRIQLQRAMALGCISTMTAALQGFAAGNDCRSSARNQRATDDSMG